MAPELGPRPLQLVRAGFSALALVSAFALAGCDSDPPTVSDGEMIAADALDGAASDSEGGSPTEASPRSDAGLGGADAVAADTLRPIPQGCIQGQFNPYFGNLHSHTAHSDGIGEPKTHFDYARTVAKVDILAITDHADYPTNSSITVDEWNECKKAAGVARTQGLLGLCGFELGVDPVAHVNVFLQATVLPHPTSLAAIYKEIASCSTSCRAQFNHPSSFSTDLGSAAENAGAASKFRLFELNPGWDKNWPLYLRALDEGWHVSAVYNQDNHGATTSPRSQYESDNWGVTRATRSGFFMGKLDILDLNKAISENRTFATADRRTSFKLMAENVCWMGSTLSGVTSLFFSVEASSPTATETFSGIELYGPGGRLLQTFACPGTNVCQASRELDVSGIQYVVARALRLGSAVVAVSAPIWIKL